MNTESREYFIQLYIEGFTDQLNDIKPRDWFGTEFDKVIYFWGRADAIENKEIDIDSILNKIKTYEF
jgi:hypothetical protein